VQASLDVVARGASLILNTWRGAFAATRAIWSDLPAVLGEVVTGAANAMVRGVERMLNALIGRVNRFIAGINTVLAALPAWAVGDDGLRIGSLADVSLGGLNNRFEGAARDAGGRAAEAFSQAFEREYRIPDLGLGAYAEEARTTQAALRGVADALRGAATGPLESVEAIREVLARTSEAADASAEAVSGIGEAFDGIAGGNEGASGAGNSSGGAAGRAANAATEAGNAIAAAGETAARGWDAVADSLQGYADSAMETVLDDAGLDAAELRAGLYDGAEVRIFVVNWQDPSQGALRLRRGWLGEVTLSSEGQWRTELRGMSQVLAQRLIEPYTPDCRADLGDARCGVDITDPHWTRPGIVTAPLDALSFTAAIDVTDKPNDWFAGGVVLFTSGPNSGRAIEVRGASLATGDLVLSFPPPFPVGTGDAFDIYPGCDKRLSTCIDRFDNVLNFRGDPFVPGADKLTETPNAR